MRHNDDGTMLAAGYADGNLFLFDTITGKSAALGGAYERGRAPVTALRFRPKGFTVGSEESEIILRETFDMIDLDGGGTLDKDEMREAAWVIKGDMGDDDMTEDQLQIIIGQLDENGDGEVDFDEFTHWWRSAVQNTEPAGADAKAVAEANLRLRDCRMKTDDATKAHGAALKQPLPDKDHLKQTFLKQRTELEAAVKSNDEAVQVALAEASSLWAKWPGVLTVGSCNGTIQCWDLSTKKMLKTLQETSGVDEDGNPSKGVNQIYALEYSHEGSIFATGGHDKVVRCYDEETKRLYAKFECGQNEDGRPGHSNRVYSLRFHPTEKNYLVSGGWSDTVQIWDLRAKKVVKKISGPHVSGDALDICGNVILTGQWKTENQLQMWDLRTGTMLKELNWDGLKPSPDEPCMVFTAQLHHASGGRYAAAGGSVVDKAGAKPSPTLKIFDTETNEVKLAAPLGAVASLNFSNDGKFLAAGSGDSAVSYYNVQSLL